MFKQNSIRLLQAKVMGHLVHTKVMTMHNCCRWGLAGTRASAGQSADSSDGAEAVAETYASVGFSLGE
eukprot:g30963.t1